MHKSILAVLIASAFAATAAMANPPSTTPAADAPASTDATASANSANGLEEKASDTAVAASADGQTTAAAASGATEEERQRVIAYLHEFMQSRSEAKDAAEARAAAWASFCQALFASAEFRYLN